jgi:hypothetical protein
MAANTRRTARLGCELLEAREVPTVSSITAAFNKAPIPAGDTLWFSSSGHVNHLPTDPSTIRVNGTSVTFTAGAQTYTVAVPDTTVNFTSAATAATVSYTADGWVVTAPRRFNGDIFLGAAALNVPTALPGGIKNVTWTTNITADAGAPQVRWHWGAAVYQAIFGTPAGLGVKAVDDRKVDAFKNGDPAGTPEDFKSFLVRGGTGDGRKEYVGNETRSRRVFPDATPTATTSSLSGTLFLDAGTDPNTFHEISADDTGYGGIEVDLFDAGNNLIATTVTADDGTYSFADLPAGTYTIVLVLADVSFNTMAPQIGTSGGTADASGAAMTVALGSEAAATGYNFGVWLSGS